MELRFFPDGCSGILGTRNDLRRLQLFSMFLIITVGKRQFTFCVKVLRVAVIDIGHRLSFLDRSVSKRCITPLDDVSVCYRAAGRSRQEQVMTAKRVIAGRINQIVFAVAHTHNVPHMRTAGSFITVHVSGHRIGSDIFSEFRKITQKFECFRISFADHLRIRVAVKHVDDFPRIDVLCRISFAVISGIVVIIGKLIYLVIEKQQFFIIRFS